MTPTDPAAGGDGPLALAGVSDDELAARARDGAGPAFAELAERWAPALYDLCGAVGDPGATEALVRTSLARAGDRIVASEGRPFGPWLAGVARDVLVEAPLADPGGDVARGLGPRRQSLLHLHLVHDFEAPALAAALGVSTGSAARVLALLLADARAAFAAAGDPDGFIAWAGRAPDAPPAGFAAQMAGEARAAWHGAPRRDAGPADASFVPAAAWVETVEPPRTSGWLLGALLAAMAGVFALALLVPASPIALTRESLRAPLEAIGLVDGTSTPGHRTAVAGATASPSASGQAAATATSATRSPSPSATAGGSAPTPTPAGAALPSPTEAAAPPTATATEPPSATPTPTDVPVPTATPTATAIATAAPSQPPPTPTACGSALRPNVSLLAIGADGRSSFTVFNNFCGAVAYTVTTLDDWLDVTPNIGTLPSGGSVVVTLFARPAGSGAYQGSIIVEGAGAAFVVEVSYSAP